ncbi:MAG: SAM-dependent methyltransferase [Candidatus Omnitrophica bacterium]|nr:SAM-dependent methyltransferase [Candidatus Omnitrophota bacterium]
MQKIKKIPGSFRDPDGYVFSHEESIYRCITHNYQDNYEHFIASGLYKALTSENLLIKHIEIDKTENFPKDAFKVIKPYLIPFISYPYEWCFSQLKQAALTTLKIQKTSMRFKMSLKDCSAYNIQFLHNRAVLIDTLSFEKYDEFRPWPAYRQFCQHFLAPLALMSYKDVRLNQLLRIFIDGIPLDMASALLPKSTYLNLPLFLHIHLHARFQKKLSSRKSPSFLKANRLGLLGMLEQLESLIKNLKFKTANNNWHNYYQDNSYSNAAFTHKKEIVSEFLDIINPKTIWDLGANKGIFSSLAAKKGSLVIAFDNEPGLIEKFYLNCQKTGSSNILPLVLDLSNPSPDIGWENKERTSLFNRGPAHTIMALALIHHLTISNNVSLKRIAAFFANNCTWAIIEFIPKDDPQAIKLLTSRKDIFSSYTRKNFEKTFSTLFKIHSQTKIKESKRTVYLIEKIK